MDNASNVNDVWASLREGENDRLSDYRKRAAALKSKSKISVVDLIKKNEKKEKEKEKVTLSGGASDQQLPREKKKNVLTFFYLISVGYVNILQTILFFIVAFEFFYYI